MKLLQSRFILSSITVVVLISDVVADSGKYSVKRYSRPSNVTLNDTNINSLLPVNYTEMGENVKASGSYHKSSRRIGLALLSDDESKQEMKSNFRVHRSGDQGSNEESIKSSQPDISSIVPSPVDNSLRPSRIAQLRKKFPRFESRFGSRIRKTGTNNTETPVESSYREDKVTENELLPENSMSIRNEPTRIRRPQVIKERTHYRTISSPFPESVTDSPSTSSPNVSPTAKSQDGTDMDSKRDSITNKFGSILKRPREPPRRRNNDGRENNEHHTQADEISSENGATVSNTYKESNKAPEISATAWVKEPKISSTMTLTDSDSFEKMDSDFHYSKGEPTQKPFIPSRSFGSGSNFHRKPDPNSDFIAMEHEPGSREYQDNQQNHASTRNEDSSSFSPADYSNADHERGKWDRDGLKYRHVPRGEEPNNIEYPRHRPSEAEVSITTRADHAPEIFRGDVRKSTANPGKENNHPRLNRFQNKIPAQNTFSGPEPISSRKIATSTGYQHVNQNINPPISNNPNWAFDPQWSLPHQDYQSNPAPRTNPPRISPTIATSLRTTGHRFPTMRPTTERIVPRPTKVPGAVDIVRRDEFPFEFWRPENENDYEHASNVRKEQRENAPPLDFKEVPDHLFTVGNGPVSVPEELARKTFEMVTAAPSFDLTSNPFEKDENFRFNSQFPREDFGIPHFKPSESERDEPTRHFSNQNHEFRQVNGLPSNSGHFSPRAPSQRPFGPHNVRPSHPITPIRPPERYSLTPLSHPPPFLTTTFLPLRSPAKIHPHGPLNNIQVIHLSANEIPTNHGNRKSINEQFPSSNFNHIHPSSGSVRPQTQYSINPAVLPSFRPTHEQNRQTPVNKNIRRPGPYKTKMNTLRRPQHVAHPQPIRGNNFKPHRPNVNQGVIPQDFSYLDTDRIRVINPHLKYSTVAPELSTSSHFDVRHQPAQVSQESKNEQSVAFRNRDDPPEHNFQNIELFFGSDPQEEQSLQPHIPPNHYIPQENLQFHRTRRPIHRPMRRRRPQNPNVENEPESSSIWSALTNFDMSFLNPFRQDNEAEGSTQIDRVASAAAAIPTALLVPGGLAVLGAGLSLFYFNFVWQPTPVVKARLASVIQNWSHANVLTAEQQKAVGDITKVYSALSAIASKLEDMDKSAGNSTLDDASSVSNHELLVSQPCKNKMVCQTYDEFDELFDITKSAATFLGNTLDHLDQEMVLQFLLAADRGHHLSDKSGNLTCDAYYPACPLPAISVKDTLRDLVGIPNLDDNSLDTVSSLDQQQRSLSFKSDVEQTKKIKDDETR